MYRGKSLEWSHGRQLDKFADVEFTYNGSGIRTSKKANGFTTKYYLNGNKIIRQYDELNILDFYYGTDGITGFHIVIKNNNKTIIHEGDYYYKKNLQGDIIGIIDSSGEQIIEYVYDAWGNQICKYLSNSGEYLAIEDNYVYNDISNINRFVAYKNPFRYRGYYFDFETGLYYLNSRYYDPQTGRFINADDINILQEAKDILNGLNLFAYCNNNPVMNSDSCGHAWWHWLIGGLIILAAAALTVITAGGFAAAGTAFAGVLGIGGATAVGGAAGVFAGITIGATIAGGIGFFSGGMSSLINGENFWDGAAKGFMWGAIGGAISGGFGAITFSSGKLLNPYTGKEIGNIFQIIGQSAISLGTYLSRSAIENETITFIGVLLAFSGGFTGGLLSKTKYQTQLFVSMLVELSILTIDAFKRVTNIPKNWFI